MTFKRKAAPCLAAAVLLIGPAPATAGEAGDRLSRLVRADDRLSTLFSSPRLRDLEGRRAWIVADGGEHRYALVVYPGTPAAQSASVGPTVCRSALLRPETQARRQALAREGYEPKVQDHLLQTLGAAGTLRGVTHQSTVVADGWMKTVCQVRLDDVQAAPGAAPTAGEVATARYEAAKEHYRAGDMDAALPLFQKLRPTDLYPNALVFIVAILLPREPALARQINERFLTLADVTDREALDLYARMAAARADTPAGPPAATPPALSDFLGR